MNIASLGSLPASSAPLPRPVSTERSSTAATPDVQTAKATNVTDQALQPASDVQPSRQELDKAVKAVNEFVGSVNNSLKFSVDEDTGQRKSSSKSPRKKCSRSPRRWTTLKDCWCSKRRKLTPLKHVKREASWPPSLHWAPVPGWI
jgi:FlaG protein